jgi:hypothetical protein
VAKAYTALMYKLAGWKTKIFKAGSASPEKVLGDLKCRVLLKVKGKGMI